jgi:hypothetical protein
MKAKVIVSRGEYGFGHTWCLVLETKKFSQRFYLGQDGKFCKRVLGMDPSEVVFRIGTREIDNDTKGNRILAKFICKQLNINGHNFKRIEAWGLCAQ